MKCEFCNRPRATAIILTKVACQECYKNIKKEIRAKEKADLLTS